MKLFYVIVSLPSIILFFSCTPLVDYRQLLQRDLQPPSFVGIKSSNSRIVQVLFSEKIIMDKKNIFIIPQPPAYSTKTDNSVLILEFTDDLTAGESYKLKTTVQDNSGNSMTLISTFYGFNPDLPAMVINEFTTQGSSSNPDRVEIAILSSGNTAGAVLYEGVDTDWKQRKVLPSIAVVTGDYIIVHFKSAGTPEEIDETSSKTASGGIKPSDEAWDLWVESGSGLSGNNGTIALFTALYGDLIDSVLYSNRTSQSDENYRGFGSTHVMDRADRIAELSGWNFSGELIAPEDSINPDDSTATRSICRNADSTDTNSREDWHIVPTSTSTFGTRNSEEVYTP